MNKKYIITYENMSGHIKTEMVEAMNIDFALNMFHMLMPYYYNAIIHSIKEKDYENQGSKD